MSEAAAKMQDAVDQLTQDVKSANMTEAPVKAQENAKQLSQEAIPQDMKSTNVEGTDKKKNGEEQPTTEEKDDKCEEKDGAPCTAFTSETSKADNNLTPFQEAFIAFAKFGEPKTSDGKHITLSQSDKWMKQAKVIDGKTITTTDTAIHFKKLKNYKVDIESYQRFLEDLAKTRRVDLNEIISKLSNCGQPKIWSNARKISTGQAAIERLTDISKYTGTHKLRFDEHGRGRGLAGRSDVPSDGYVHGYQNKNTYSKTH